MARTLGRVRGSYCGGCHGEPAGPDCSDRGKDARTMKRVEARELWAQDWDCPEDAGYDNLTTV